AVSFSTTLGAGPGLLWRIDLLAVWPLHSRHGVWASEWSGADGDWDRDATLYRVFPVLDAQSDAIAAADSCTCSASRTVSEACSATHTRGKTQVWSVCCAYRDCLPVGIARRNIYGYRRHRRTSVQGTTNYSRYHPAQFRHRFYHLVDLWDCGAYAPWLIQ